jgi:hypothetical protein
MRVSALTSAEGPDEKRLTRPVQASTPAEPGVFRYDPRCVGRHAVPATLKGKGEEAFFENATGLVPSRAVLPVRGEEDGRAAKVHP